MIGKTSMRLFSTAKHTPPKKLHGIPGRYAEAVYVAASKVSIFYDDLFIRLLIYEILLINCSFIYLFYIN